MKKIFNVIKRIVKALFLLYTFNLITSGVGVLIPINIPSVLIVGALGLPSVFALIILKKFI